MNGGELFLSFFGKIDIFYVMQNLWGFQGDMGKFLGATGSWPLDC